MNYRILFSLLIILIIIFSGCIDNNEKIIKNPKDNDIQLITSMEKNNIQINSSNINITIKIINNLSEKISIYKDYRIRITQEIITPDNSSLIKMNIDDFSKDRIMLNGKEKREFSINLKERTFYLENERFNWNMTGKYKIRCKYRDIEETFYSDYIEFNLIK